MQKRLELLRKQREELVRRREEDMKEMVELALRHSPILAELGVSAPGLSRAGHAESGEIPQLRQRPEAKKLRLSVGLMCAPEDIRARADPAEKKVFEESEEDGEDLLLPSFGAFDLWENRSEVVKQEEAPNFKVLAAEEVDELLLRQPGLLDALRGFEALLAEQLGGAGAAAGFIEDYLYAQNLDVHDQKGGYTARKYDDFEGKCVAHDAVFFSDSGEEGDRLAVVYALGLDAVDYSHAIGIYSEERRCASKYCRSEVKRVAPASQSSLLLGGLDSGKIAVWDLRSDRKLQDLTTKAGDKCNYLPVVDLHVAGSCVYAVGQEGRLCKWDMRKFEEPLVAFDIYSENDNITRLEAMPLGMAADPLQPELFYVNTVEGAVYAVSLANDVGEQRAAYPALHEAPIVQLQCLDVADFMAEAAPQRRFSETAGAAPPPANYWVSASLDWKIKLFRGDFGSPQACIDYHREFVTSVAANRRLNPFVFASADVEGRLAVWRLDRPGWDSPLCEWANTAPIHRLAWSPDGKRLAAVDARGGVHVLSFPKSRLALSERAISAHRAEGLALNLKSC